MKTDHTKDVEKRVEAIRVERLDGCSFCEPKEEDFTPVKLCIYCRFGQFESGVKNGLCKYKK